MGTRGLLRSMGALARQIEREDRRQRRLRHHEFVQAQRAHAQATAQAVVADFEDWLELLSSIHRSAHAPIDWASVVDLPKPEEPEALPVSEAAIEAAAAALEAHKPGWFARVFGSAAKVRERLEDELRDARQLVAQRHDSNARALSDYEQALDRHADTRSIAMRVVDRQVSAYGEAINELDCLREVVEACKCARLEMTLSADAVEAVIIAPLDAVVPDETLSLTSTGKLSRKKFAETKRMEIYQDFICGSALRVVRELFAVLPIANVVVHVDAKGIDSATGNAAQQTVLSLSVERTALDALNVNWDLADASDLVTRLGGAMAFKRGKGFSAVERLTATAS